jgi:hypothetical protein
MDAEPLEVIRLARESVRVDPDARMQLQNYAQSVERIDPSTAAKIRELLADTAREFSIHQNAAMNRQIEGIPGTPAK